MQFISSILKISENLGFGEMHLDKVSRFFFILTVILLDKKSVFKLLTFWRLNAFRLNAVNFQSFDISTIIYDVVKTSIFTFLSSSRVQARQHRNFSDLRHFDDLEYIVKTETVNFLSYWRVFAFHKTSIYMYLLRFRTEPRETGVYLKLKGESALLFKSKYGQSTFSLQLF